MWQAIDTKGHWEGKIWNRRKTFSDISIFKERQVQARRADNLLAVCCVDLDGFTEINDRYDYDAGDEFVLLLSGINMDKCDHAACAIA